ncbi:hypothetical protein TorRG33x02_167600, partial [Trema orientale]
MAVREREREDSREYLRVLRGFKREKEKEREGKRLFLGFLSYKTYADMLNIDVFG